MFAEMIVHANIVLMGHSNGSGWRRGEAEGFVNWDVGMWRYCRNQSWEAIMIMHIMVCC